MSGGHFRYKQYALNELTEEVERLIATNKRANEWGDTRNYPKEVIDKFKKAVKLLKEAEAYVHEIDWLVSGDTDEESFLENLNQQLLKLDKE